MCTWVCSACVLLAKLPDQSTDYREGVGSGQPPVLFRGTAMRTEDSGIGDPKTGPRTVEHTS